MVPAYVQNLPILIKCTCTLVLEKKYWQWKQRTAWWIVMVNFLITLAILLFFVLFYPTRSYFKMISKRINTCQYKTFSNNKSWNVSGALTEKLQTTSTFVCSFVFVFVQDTDICFWHKYLNLLLGNRRKHYLKTYLLWKYKCVLDILCCCL